MATKIILNRKQFEQLKEITDKFQDVDRFTLVSDSSNGIGPVLKVIFTVLNKDDASIDITDVSDW